MRTTARTRPVDSSGDTLLAGQGVPYGWLVAPHTSPDATAANPGPTVADIEQIVAKGIAAADQTRSQIRLPFNSSAKMVFAISDEDGNILGLYRMPDATYFSIGVAVAKARNIAYYDNPALLQPQDKIKGVPAGTAFTSRTLRYVSLPFFPEGIDIDPPGPGNILTDGGVTKYATNQGPPLPANAFQSIQGYNDFNPETNFHEVITPENAGNQNGVVLFPGSAPLYKDTTGSGMRSTLIGALGASGDGVFQDDDITSVASVAYAPPANVDRADQVKVRGRATAVPQVQSQSAPAAQWAEIPDRPFQRSSLADSPTEERPLSRSEPMRLFLLRSSVVGLILAAGTVARAQDPASECPCLWHRLHRQGTPPPGKPRSIPHTDEAAGYPRSLAGHIEPSVTPGGIGYYVGGGVAWGHGENRGRHDGTWGWDETGGWRHRRRGILGWSGGRKYQGGTGAYRTDGHVPPDYIYAGTSTANSLGRREEGEE